MHTARTGGLRQAIIGTFPNFPAHISMTKVDYVVEVDQIGDPKKIATGAAKPTTDMRKLRIESSVCLKLPSGRRILLYCISIIDPVDQF